MWCKNVDQNVYQNVVQSPMEWGAEEPHILLIQGLRSIIEGEKWQPVGALNRNPLLGKVYCLQQLNAEVGGQYPLNV